MNYKIFTGSRQCAFDLYGGPFPSCHFLGIFLSVCFASFREPNLLLNVILIYYSFLYPQYA